MAAIPPAAESELLLPMTGVQVGSLVHVRQRQWIVKSVTPGSKIGELDLVDLACVDDDAQGTSTRTRRCCRELERQNR